MDTENTGARTEGADEKPVQTDELQEFLRSVHFILGEGADGVSPRPWPGLNRTEPPISGGAAKLEIVDHVEVGRLVADWAADPASRPTGAAELASQLRGAATLPGDIRSVRFVQDAPGTLTIRLPAVDALVTGLSELSDPMREAGCPVPGFYVDQHRPGIGQVLTPVDMYLARIGDLSLGGPC